jgi:hypothetical protein
VAMVAATLPPNRLRVKVSRVSGARERLSKVGRVGSVQLNLFWISPGALSKWAKLVGQPNWARGIFVFSFL